MRALFVVAALLLAGCSSAPPAPDAEPAAAPSAPPADDVGQPADDGAQPGDGAEPGGAEPADAPEPAAPETPWRMLSLPAGGTLAALPRAELGTGPQVVLVAPEDVEGLEFLGIMSLEGDEALHVAQHAQYIGWSFEGPFAEAFQDAMPKADAPLVVNATQGWLVVAAKAAQDIQVAVRAAGPQVADPRADLAAQGASPMAARRAAGVHAAFYFEAGFAGSADFQVRMTTPDAVLPERGPVSPTLPVPGDRFVFGTSVEWARWSHMEAVGADQSQRTFQFRIDADLHDWQVAHEGTQLLAGPCGAGVCTMPPQHDVILQDGGIEGSVGQVELLWLGAGSRMALAFVHLAFGASVEELTGFPLEQVEVLPGKHLDVGPVDPPVSMARALLRHPTLQVAA